MTNILELMRTFEDSKYTMRVIPCTYASTDKTELMCMAAADERDLTVSYVKVNFDKTIYAAFTEPQYEVFEKCPRHVDFAAIVDGYFGYIGNP